jgi:hypothetical protein
VSFLIKLKKNRILLMVLGGYAFVFSSVNARELPFPAPSHAGMPVQLKVSGLAVDKGDVFVFPDSPSVVIKIPFDTTNKATTSPFGGLAMQSRIQISGSAYPGRWRGFYSVGEQVVVWDSTILQLLVLQKKDFSVVRSVTVPLDVVKPALDRGGEASHQEVKRLRNKLRGSFKSLKGDRFSGLAEIPSDWEGSKGRRFLISTRLSGFPLLLMACDRDDAANCYIERQCQLHGASPQLNANSAGIGINAEKRAVLIANSFSNTIEVFKYDRCGSVQKTGVLKIPTKLPKVETIYLDALSRLWMGTGVIDTQVDANIFFWEKESWM